jgi:glutamyl-tRNA reductase
VSLVVMGVSHRSAPIALLESVALDDDGRAALAAQVSAADPVSEVVVLSTCNRTEIYAESQTFHGAVSALTDALVGVTGVRRDLLRDHLYVHYEDRAIAHAFTVACGLDSMAIGEAQILGQMRLALREGQRAGQVGPALNGVFQHALRVGKKAHTETGIDSVSVSLVEAGMHQATTFLGSLRGLSVVVVGAGGMSSLAATTAARLGARDLVVVNRTAHNGQRLAIRVGGRARPMSELAAALAGADVVVSCTGSVGLVVSLADAGDAQVARAGRPQAYVDLALPHDVAPEVGSLSGVQRIGLDTLGDTLAASGPVPQVQQVADLVIAEVAAYLTARAAESVAPTVAALRASAARIVEGELARLEQRTPGMTPVQRDEVRLAVHRVVEKLLHTPTVRVKELVVGAQDGADYARALRDLFDLGPGEAAVVSTPPADPEVLA